MAGSGICSNCGTALPDADPLGLITCPSCGSITKLGFGTEPEAVPDAPTGAGWPAPPVAAPPPSTWAAPAPVAGAPTVAPPAPGRPGGGGGKQKKRKGSGATKKIGCSLGPLIAIGGIIFGIVMVVQSCDTSTISNNIRDTFGGDATITISGSATVLGGPDGKGDVATVIQTYENSQSTRRVGRISFSGDSSTLRWSSEPLGDDAYRAEIVLVGDTVFAAIDDRLLALDAATGETRWKTTMRDKVTIGCPGCFAAVRGRLVVRTTDAYVSAYGTVSDEVLWSKRLNSPSGSISVVGDRLFVVDDGEDSGAVTPVTMTDPATGRAIRASTPTCPESQDGHWKVEMSPGDPVRAVPGSTDVMAVFGFGDGCVVRWNPDTGASVWTSRMTGLSSFDQEDVVVGRNDMVLGNSEGTQVTVFLPNGKARLLSLPADTMAQVGKIVGRTLVSYTATTRGTPKGGLAAWDLSTGERIWANASLGSATAVSSSPYGTSDALFDGSPRSLLVPYEGGLNVFVFEGTDGTFAVSPVSLDTGKLGTTIRRAFLTRYESGGTPSLTIEGTSGEHLIISIDTLLQAIPINGRGDVVSYPEKN